MNRTLDKAVDFMIGGSGGQGVLLLASLVAETAAENYPHVSYFPNYAPAQRGGECEATVVISSEEIGSALIFRPGMAVALNDIYSKTFANRMPEGGLLFYDETVTRSAPSAKVRACPIKATEAAMEIGNKQAANMVMLGAFVRKTDLVELDDVLARLEIKAAGKRPELMEINRKAILKGAELARAAG